MPLSSVLKWVERKGLLVFAEFQPKITQSPSPWRDPASKQLAEDDRREKTWLSSGFYACAQANILAYICAHMYTNTHTNCIQKEKKGIFTSQRRMSLCFL